MYEVLCINDKYTIFEISVLFLVLSANRDLGVGILISIHMFQSLNLINLIRCENYITLS